MRTHFLAGIFVLSTSLLVAQTPAKVDGLDASTAETVISATLAAKQIGGYSKLDGVQEWISDFEEFNSHLVERYRARYDFRLEGNVLWVSMQDLQEFGSDGWAQPSFPAKGAEQKLIAQMADRLNATRSALPSPEAQATNPSPGVQPVALVRTAAPVNPAQHIPLATEAAPRANVTTRDNNSAPDLSKAKAMIFSGNHRYRCSDGMCAIEKDGLWGFVDYHGTQVIPLQYLVVGNEVPYFTHGTCLVDAKDAQGNFGKMFIDKKGKILFGRGFFNAQPFDDVVTTVILTPGDQMWSLIDLQGHIVAAKTVGGNVEFHDGLAVDEDSAHTGLNGYRNTKMQWAIPPTYFWARPFHEGIAWVASQVDGGVTKWGAIDLTGKQVIPFMYTLEPGSFSDGMASVSCLNPIGSGYIDTTGKLTVPCRPGVASPFLHGHALFTTGIQEMIDKQGNIVDGRTGPNGSYPPGADPRPRPFKLREDGLYIYRSEAVVPLGLMDADWNIIIPAGYFGEDISLFPLDNDPDGLAWVTLTQAQQRYQGFMNREGEFILLQRDSAF